MGISRDQIGNKGQSTPFGAVKVQTDLDCADASRTCGDAGGEVGICFVDPVGELYS